MLSDSFSVSLLSLTGASRIKAMECIQKLWSGYGNIIRVGLEGADRESVIVKHIKCTSGTGHPRGWDSDRSHMRKLQSYEVETNWYQNLAGRCDDECRIPECLKVESNRDDLYIILEDLDPAGFSGRRSSATWHEIRLCLSWLAHFHACFLGASTDGLWETGTYWHLQTRPDELKNLEDHELRDAAFWIDSELNSVRWKTIVHGDAKIANFCFSDTAVAALDFQYVGGGCGMKDLAYFIGSCLNEQDCERHEQEILNIYFTSLAGALKHYGKKISCTEIEAEWRPLYHFAWTDFHRFLKGWSPGHWKINSYSERVSRQVLESRPPCS